MKRVGFLYDKICDVDNIKLAIRNASKGKRKRGYVYRILINIDHYAEEISNLLKTKRFIPSPNRQKTIRDGACGKERIITIPAFYPDQIIHWAIIQIIQPVLMKGMYAYSCGSVPGRGGRVVKKYVEKVQRRKDAKYVLKLDIRKFYPSIQHDKLMKLLSKRIKDRDLLNLLWAIIQSGGRGLPIGYYTSQWLANFYMQEVDHYIKEELKVKYYVRYVDDMVLLGPNKWLLKVVIPYLTAYLLNNGYGLKLKRDWQLWKIYSRPLDFVGYRFYRGYTLLRKRIFYRLMRTVRNIQKNGLNICRARRFNSLVGWASHINFAKYYLTHIKPIVSKHTSNRYISRYDRKRQIACI